MKNIRSLIILLIFLLAAAPSAAAQSSNYAEGLNHLGLFSGTENGYELSRVPTRAESLVMMLRLWGKEDEALKSTYKNPFKDTGWESRYVSYAYAKGVVNGINEYSFGGNRPTSLNQYCSMVLRVLGYSETKGDFTYETAVSFASLVLGIDLTKDPEFNRGTLAKISSYVVNTRPKNQIATLGQTLSETDVFTTQGLNEARSLWEQDKNAESSTILIYAVGSDLESQQGRLTDDLEEILRGQPNQNTKILIQTGGTLKYHNNYMTDGASERFEVVKGQLKKHDSHIQTAASDPKTLKDFLVWGKTVAPSDRYILILWDHGYGTMGGFGADELNERKTMKVSELSKAIGASDMYFDLIVFDACLMGTVETAYALRDHGKYLIASEDSTPAAGLYYTTWIGAMERNPQISTERVGRLILDSFTLHSGIEAKMQTTMSMMKLSQAESLVKAIEHAEFDSSLTDLANNAELLGKNDGIFDQYDLIEIMGESSEITAAAQALAFEVRNSAGYNNRNGVALYVPNRKIAQAHEMKEELKAIDLSSKYIETILNGK
ncbi:clostripain-related cysteine peptidase [Paenibacillus sp. MMS20-IR301]|uniref:clostripain-related cysteine peptidase n=1 Tax=Paenibacillus sp. MMS20-IR301 TaxID=2895946 RepID=UPI0028E6980A|nr:clostripain-related cysteine peptidase [Paenibacillus sp. MMS20-IR301]WNS41217.1 clostripain-related cysteine peptidase [Paenibacillus sp. MMS20-IR301]